MNLQAPKKASRSIEPMFKKWIRRKFNLFDKDKFIRADDIAFLNDEINF